MSNHILSALMSSFQTLYAFSKCLSDHHWVAFYLRRCSALAPGFMVASWAFYSLQTFASASFATFGFHLTRVIVE
jgi:hypothetical protein